MPKMKALLGWEIGGGQGHIHRLAAISRLLTEHHIEPVLVLKNPNHKGIDLPWKVLQAPLPILKTLDGKTDITSYLLTDLLYIFGFSEPLTLHFHLQAWQNVINLVQPDLIFADFAPALVLAARGKIPTIVIGSDFAVPPPVDEFPPIRHPVPTDSYHRQSQVIQVVRQVTGFDAPLGELLNGDDALIFSIQELDPYCQARHQPKYVGIHNAPIAGLADKNGSAWGYLSEDWCYYSLVTEMIQPHYEFGALEKVLSGKSSAIHHGGSTTSIAALLAGIPQLIFPQHQEQVLRAKALEEMGVARMITYPNPQNLKEALALLPNLFQKARTIAQHLSWWNRNHWSDTVRSCLNTYL